MPLIYTSERNILFIEHSMCFIGKTLKSAYVPYAIFWYAAGMCRYNMVIHHLSFPRKLIIELSDHEKKIDGILSKEKINMPYIVSDN